MVLPDPYRRARPLSPGVATGAVVGVVAVLWWRWVRAALWGAALAVAAVGAGALLTGAEPTGDLLDAVLALAFVLGFWGTVGGLLVWWRRAGWPGWLGRRWWAVYALGGLAVGALVPVALVGVAPGAGLAGGVLGAVLGLAWAFARRTPGVGRAGGATQPGARPGTVPPPRRPAERRTVEMNHDPVVEDDVAGLLRRIGLEDDDPGPSSGLHHRRRPSVG